jgi:hypothetical protein
LEVIRNPPKPVQPGELAEILARWLVIYRHDSGED